MLGENNFFTCDKKYHHYCGDSVGREDVAFLKNVQLRFQNLGGAKSGLSFLFCYS